MTPAAWRRLEGPDAELFARKTLLAPSRTTPVVALTTASGEREPWIDPAQLAAELGDRAEVVLLETGDATWSLSAALPKRLDVYGGAARIWWPGLTPDSDPFDHPLLFIYDSTGADLTRQRILAAILEDDEAAGRWGPWRPPSDRSPRPSAAARSAATRPPLPQPPASPRPESPRPESQRTAESWQRIAEEYRAGDVVPGRVFRVAPHYVLVELLPGAGVMVPLSEIDSTWVREPSEILKVGERVNVELRKLDPPSRRGLASIERALLATPREGLSLRPGEPPYLGAEGAKESEAHVRRVLQRDQEALRQQGEELDLALEDRRRLTQHNEELRQQCASLRKELRSAEDRVHPLESKIAGDLDPLSSGTAFLATVRVDHARRLDEADRLRYPLARMRVGRAFLESLRGLEGIDPAKVVEVCAQVASGRAHEVPSRAVHELSAGETGKGIVRAADGAKAWRCSLQAGSPSARRLHWWVVPGPDGATVEFASVAVHDEFSIPE